MAPSRFRTTPLGAPSAGLPSRPSPLPPESIPEEPASEPFSAAEERPELSRFDRIGRQVIEAGLLALIVFTPLPAGSVNPWAVLVIELTTVLLAAVYFLMSQPPHVNSKLQRKLLYPRLGFAALLLVYVPFQMLRLPGTIVRFLSPKAFAFREAYASAGGLKAMSLSLAPARTIEDGLGLLASVLAGFLVVRVIVHRRQIVRMMAVIVASGVFQAVYGLFELTRSQPRILFYPKVHNLDSVTGTFVNRNHFAGYLELVIPLALALLISRIELLAMPGMKWRRRLAALTSRGATANVVLAIGFLAMALGILKSNSRSGAVLLALTFLLFMELILFTFGRMKLRRAWIMRALKIGLLLVALIALYSGVESMIGRFSMDNLLQDGRPRYWMAIMRVIKDFPLVGTGLGTFGLVYDAYETLGLQGMFDHAHNDYLEYLSELGIAGFGLLLASILFVAADSLLVWLKRRSSEAKALAMGGLVAIVIMLLHILTDFNLQIPATMFLFAVILGLTWSTAYYRKA
jgi:O-antigen ligase